VGADYCTHVPLGGHRGEEKEKAIHHICGFRHIKGRSTGESAFMSPFQGKWRRTILINKNANDFLGIEQ
jgi:hypothetical protein